MNEKVQEFINNINEQKEQDKARWKKDRLLEMGLTEKEYSPDGKASEVYNQYEVVEIDGESKTKYYKTVPLSVTDEEFEQVEKALEEKEYYKHKKDLASAKKYFNIFKVMPLVVFWLTMVVAFIGGIVLASFDGNFMLPIVIGSIVGAIEYFITKIIVAPTVLSVEYLSLLSQDKKIK